jgi:DNA topoisomerase-3
LAKALVIAEKPSVARDIAAMFGDCTEHDGYFENDRYVVTFAVGHLFELLPPEEVDDKYKRWTLDALPILPEEYRYRPKKGQSDRIRTIRELLERADVDEVINACDAGREGELIFREIVDHLDSHKPIRRLWLQSMTDKAIRRGFEDLRPGEELEGLAAAAACRARSDWLIGMNATRAFTKRLKSRKEKTAWSAGRVQTPTLAMLVVREHEVLAHVPRPYWKVNGSFAFNGHSYTGVWFDPAFKAGDDEALKDDRIFEEERASAVATAVSGQTAAARESRKPSRETAPPLFDLTSLQREGHRRFGWSARRTLSAAQRCYDRHKLLTYPRTNSRCLPSDYRDTVDSTLSALAGAAGHPGDGFADYAASASHLQRAGLENTKRVFDDKGISDHFAIIPTGALPSQPLTGDDLRLFDLVTRRFLSAFFPPAVWERVERVTEVGGESFRTRERTLKEAGWRSCLKPSASDEGSDSGLAPLVSGQDEATGVAVRSGEAELVAEETKPLPRITEARLLSLMENAGKQIEDEDLAAVMHEKGIGTPATRADVIENLIAKGYAVRMDRALRPTVKGIRLIDTLQRIHVDRLTSAELTGEIEFHLLQVERGGRTAEDFMREITEYACEIVERAKTFEYEELYDLRPLGKCPSCGRDVIEMAWFYRCEPEPDVTREDDCPMRFWKDTSGRYLDRATVAALLKDGVAGPLDGFTARSGRTYKGNIELDREAWQLKVRSLGYNEGEGVSDQPEYEVNSDPLGGCPFEEECQILESPRQFVCERTLKEEELGKDEERPKSCGFVMPRTVCKREIVRDEALVYLKTGKTELLTDFTSRFGRPFAATLVLKENGRHGFEFQPRTGGRGGAQRGGGAGASDTQVKRKKATRKKSPRKKTPRKKTAAKKASRKRASPKQGTRKSGTSPSSKRKPSSSASKPARPRKDG